MNPMDHEMEMLLDAAGCSPVEGGPHVDQWVAPHSVEQAADIMRAATDHEHREPAREAVAVYEDLPVHVSLRGRTREGRRGPC